MDHDPQPALPPDTELRISWRRIGSDRAIIGLLFASALFMRLYFLRFYHVISNDGTAYVGAAKALSQGDLSGVASYGFYPVLVWIAHLGISDWETAGRIASIILGTLLVIPLYLLGREFFTRQAVVAGCLLTIAWGTIRHWSCEVMSQSTYITLVIAGIYFVWKMTDKPSCRTGFIAGISLGFAYMTRTEGVLLFLVMPLAPLAARRTELRHLLKPLGAYCTGFSLLFIVNAILVYQATGVFQLASKTSVALNDGLSYYLNILDLNYIPDYAPKGYIDIFRDHPEYFWINTAKNLREALRTIVPPYLWVIAVIGFLAGGFTREANTVRYFLLSTFAPLLVIIVFYYIGPEYTQPYLPIIFLWAGRGVNTIWDFLLKRAGSRQMPAGSVIGPASLTLVTAILFSVYLTVRQLPDIPHDAPYTPEMDDGRRDQKNMGLVLKQHLPPGKIMTRWARIAFYSDREWINIPKADFDQIMQTARNGNVRYLIVDGGLWSIRPELGDDLFAPVASGGFPNGLHFNRDPNSRIRPGLHPFMVYMNQPASMGFAVYEILP